MAMYIFTEKILKGEPIKVYNYGEMHRDFTYIDDIIDGIISSIKKNYDCEIFNLGNSKSENLMNVVNLIENNLGLKAKIEFESLQPGDIVLTINGVAVDARFPSKSLPFSIGLHVCL